VGDSLTLRDYDGQVAEAMAMVRALNRMTKAGMPESVRIAENPPPLQGDLRNRFINLNKIDGQAEVINHSLRIHRPEMQIHGEKIFINLVHKPWIPPIPGIVGCKYKVSS
jgi:hypothetical protein